MKGKIKPGFYRLNAVGKSRVFEVFRRPRDKVFLAVEYLSGEGSPAISKPAPVLGEMWGKFSPM